MPHDPDSTPLGGDFVPMLRQTVEEIVDRHDDAIRLFEKAHDALQEAAEAVKAAKAMAERACPKGVGGMNHQRAAEIEAFYRADQVPGREEFLDTARKILAINVWSHIVESTRLMSLMDHEAKKQFREQMAYTPPPRRSREVARPEDRQGLPPITAENIVATIEQFAAQAPTIMARGVANAFAKLDRRFRSHDGFKIGSRVILTRAFNGCGRLEYGETRDTLIDIERVFAILDGRADGTFDLAVNALCHSRPFGSEAKQSVAETPYFRIRGFMNGNAHLWFTRPDLVEKVNVTLGEYYGEDKLGYDVHNPRPDPLKNPKRELAKDFAFFPTPDAVAEKVIDAARLYRRDGEEPLTVLEPSAGTGNLARRCAVQRYDSRKYSNETGREFRHVVDCVEVQPPLADALRRTGLYRSVVCGDFLDVQSAPRKPYDRVAMNPPFDRERDIDHVVHALGFLKPTGLLVAVMSAGTEFRETKKAQAFRELMASLNARWTDLPPGSFSSVGTNVNTILLTVSKDGARNF